MVLLPLPALRAGFLCALKTCDLFQSYASSTVVLIASVSGRCHTLITDHSLLKICAIMRDGDTIALKNPSIESICGNFHSSLQAIDADSLHRTLVMPNRSAIGFEYFFGGGLPGFGMGAIPASQHAQCHASALSIVFDRMRKVFDIP